MNKRENFLEAIRFGRPRYVPPGNEDVWYNFWPEGNIRQETWTDDWGVGWVVEMEKTSPFPKGNPLADTGTMRDYVAPDPDRLRVSDATIREIRAVDRREQMVMAYYSYLLFDRAWALMGMDNFMMALYTHPEDCRRFLHVIAEYARRFFQQMIDLGIDAIHTGEDLGTQRALMISPSVFRDFLLPEYAYCFQDLVKAKKIINFHSCGCIGAVAVDLATVGVTILNPIQRQANDLAELKRSTYGKLSLWGGVDSGVLMHGTPDQVRAVTGEVMEILKPGGGFICAPDQYFPDMPGENMQALWEAVKEFGAYY